MPFASIKNMNALSKCITASKEIDFLNFCEEFLNQGTADLMTEPQKDYVYQEFALLRDTYNSTVIAFKYMCAIVPALFNIPFSLPMSASLESVPTTVSGVVSAPGSPLLAAANSKKDHNPATMKTMSEELVKMIWFLFLLARGMCHFPLRFLGFGHQS
jgi:hypothetical protein